MATHASEEVMSQGIGLPFYGKERGAIFAQAATFLILAYDEIDGVEGLWLESGNGEAEAFARPEISPQ